MEILDMGANCIHGAVPPPPVGWVTGDSRLINFSFSVNYISSTLPTEIAQLSKLESLELSNNHVSGTLDYRLPVGLVHVDLSSNWFSGTISPTVTALPNVTTLYLDDNLFTVELQSTFALMSNMWQLDLSNNCFFGVLPAGLCAMGELSYLLLTCLSCAKHVRSR